MIFGNVSEHKEPNKEGNYSYHYNAFKFKCIESSQKSPIAFLMDDYLALIKLSDIYQKNFNFQLLSIFHSHPGSAIPSGVDIPYMESFYKSNIKKFRHLIWTIMNARTQELKGFIYIFDELKQINVTINKT